jgi:hypothetical protein
LFSRKFTKEFARLDLVVIEGEESGCLAEHNTKDFMRLRIEGILVKSVKTLLLSFISE